MRAQDISLKRIACLLFDVKFMWRQFFVSGKKVQYPQNGARSPATRTGPYLSHASAMESFCKEAMPFVCVCLSILWYTVYNMYICLYNIFNI